MADSSFGGTLQFTSGTFPFFGNAATFGSIAASYIDNFNSGTVVVYALTASEPAPMTSSVNLPIYTRDLDGLRDGVSIVTNRQRYGGVRPVFWSGYDDNEVKQINFGHDNYIRSNVSSFSDVNQNNDIDSVIALFYSGTQSVTAFFSYVDGDDNDTESYDGIIEPLDIRSTIPNLTSVSHRFPRSSITPKHVLSGELAEGGLLDTSKQIDQFYMLNDNRIALPFVDSGTYKNFESHLYTASSGHMSGQVVQRAEILSQQNRNFKMIAAPFNDAIVLTPSTPKSFVQVRILRYESEVSSSDRTNFIDAYTHKSASTDVEEYRNRRFMGTGMQYHDSIHGTDSIAFGGLKRYRRPVIDKV